MCYGPLPITTELPRSARNVKRETRSARAELTPRKTSDFVTVAKGRRRGYYRGRLAGT